MSIWCDLRTIGQTSPGDVRGYADGWSNHYPSSDVEKPARVHLATVAPHCVPERPRHRGDQGGPWLRMSPSTWNDDHGRATIPRGGSVVLSPQGARELAAALLDWANEADGRAERA